MSECCRRLGGRCIRGLLRCVWQLRFAVHASTSTFSGSASACGAAGLSTLAAGGAGTVYFNINSMNRTLVRPPG
jgi:hypothetical protein